MEPLEQDDERYRHARARVQALKSFYIHAAVYVLVNIMLFVIDAADGSNWWFYWPLLGWGIGLAAHGFAVFAMGGVFGADWEARKIREIMERDR
jgi:hypothetical protein